MKPTDATELTHYHVAESKSLEEDTDRISRILDAKYAPADLNKVAAENGDLSVAEQKKLLALLKKYESLFDGSLGRWKGTEYKIQLKDDAKPFGCSLLDTRDFTETTDRLRGTILWMAPEAARQENVGKKSDIW